MSLAPWRSLISRALHLNRSLVYARYFQLATVKKNGRPANRTVVFRGFWGETNKLKIITDSRSQKFTEIQEQSGGEICWYFPKTREQFRLSGEITLIGCNNYGQDFQQARQSTWQEFQIMLGYNLLGHIQEKNELIFRPFHHRLQILLCL